MAKNKNEKTETTNDFNLVEVESIPTTRTLTKEIEALKLVILKVQDTRKLLKFEPKGNDDDKRKSRQKFKYVFDKAKNELSEKSRENVFLTKKGDNLYVAYYELE